MLSYVHPKMIYSPCCFKPFFSMKHKLSSELHSPYNLCTIFQVKWLILNLCMPHKAADLKSKMANVTNLDALWIQKNWKKTFGQSWLTFLWHLIWKTQVGFSYPTRRNHCEVCIIVIASYVWIKWWKCLEWGWRNAVWYLWPSGLWLVSWLGIFKGPVHA